MADLKRIVPPSDFSSQDFLSSDYQTTAEESVIISEQVVCVKRLAPQIVDTEPIEISEQITLSRELVRNTDTDNIEISETSLAILAQEKTKVVPAEQVTITEQVSWLLQEAPEAPANVFLSPAARRRYPGRPRYALEPEKEPQVAPLVTKVKASCKFLYSISSGPITVEHDAVADQIASLQKTAKLKSVSKPDVVIEEERPVSPISLPATIEQQQKQEPSETQGVGFAPRGDIGDIAGVAGALNLPTSKIKVLTGIKMQYAIQNEVFAHLSARYTIKDGALHSKLVKIGKMLAILDSIDI